MPTFRLRTATEIGALIRARRMALGLDQAELAEKVGVSRLWVNQVERGKPGAGLGLVLRTLTVVGVDLTWTEVAASLPAGRKSGPSARAQRNINSVIDAARRPRGK